MKIQTLMIAALLFVATPFIAAQGTQQHSGKMPQDCQQMMNEHQQTMQEMQQKDQALQKKLEAMNSSRGDQKIQAMADIINDLVHQRKEMLQKMNQMQMKMMSHMASHMASPQGMQSMAQCPMMKGQTQR